LALIVLSVANDDNCLSHGMIGPVLQKFIFAGMVDRIVKRRPTAIMQLVHSSREQLHVVCKILRHLAVAVEANDKRLIVAGAKGVIQETGGRVLLEIEPAVHRSTDIDQQTQVQRQIGLTAEVENRLGWLVVVENAEIALV